MNKVKTLFATTFLALGLFVTPLYNGVIGDVELDAKLTVDKAVVEPGDTLTYTFRVENTIDETFLVYLAPGMNGDHPFSPYVDYVPGSTVWNDNSGATGNVDDNWLNTGVNLNDLDPGDWVTLTFKADVQEDAPNQALIESVIQIKKTWLGDEINEWFQCAAKSTVNAGEVLGEVLPETGSSEIFLISGYALYLGVLLRKLKLNRYL
jgi:hypothetical protein